MRPELRVRLQVDEMKLHLRSICFDLREKRGTHSSCSTQCDLLTSSSLSVTVTIEAKKASLQLQSLAQGRGFQCFCDEQELGIHSGIDPSCKLAAAGG